MVVAAKGGNYGNVEVTVSDCEYLFASYEKQDGGSSKPWSVYVDNTASDYTDNENVLPIGDSGKYYLKKTKPAKETHPQFDAAADHSAVALASVGEATVKFTTDEDPDVTLEWGKNVWLYTTLTTKNEAQDDTTNAGRITVEGAKIAAKTVTP